MTRFAVTISERAIADVRDISEYIGDANLAAAEQFGEEFVLCVRLLRDFPYLGRQIQGKKLRTRDLRVVTLSPRFSKYLVVHRKLDSSTLEIVRVVHGARNLPSVLE